MTIRLAAPAKINFGLRVLDRRPDGYHEIETLFLPLDLCDWVEVEIGPEPGIQLEIEGADLPTDSENLAVRAALRTCEALGIPARLRLRLEKQIPIAAGLGGGSSDAAATLRAIEQLTGRSLPDAQRLALARGLGADVPFFLDPTPALGTGIGEKLTPLADVPAIWWLLIAFPFGVSTPRVYAEASRELTLPRRRSSIAALLGPSGVVSRPPNDLELVTSRWHPEVESTQALLREHGAKVTGMSGSGPTVYGQFDSREQAERASDRMHASVPSAARRIVARSSASRHRSGAGERASAEPMGTRSGHGTGV